MKAPISIRLGARIEQEIIIPPSGFEIYVQMDCRTVCMAGDNLAAAIIHEYPAKATGIPKEISPWIRYVVPMVAFEALADRKDFVTPARPIRDSFGVVRAYRHLRGHEKQEVTRFFQEAGANSLGVRS
jgi:hypothetical protein